ncbi:hypothetical protein IE53DRAFT_383746 [Violaceomyces palustris]|uniref:Uncharacterized protein n=1 Tax=Violaceomyces palustris TaxID=1673888 RepID=A0ACD0P6S8_9BASI|nr:hypothetical protein IE53DRAFT_383746 [Violaceomyces palustris]
MTQQGGWAHNNADVSMTSDPSQDGARSVEELTLLALKSFKECQERRVAHWNEYEDAMKTHLSPSANRVAEREPRGVHGEATELDPRMTGSSLNDPGQILLNHSCSAHDHGSNGAGVGSGRGIDDGVMKEILRLVTEGLISCSHEARAIQTELLTNPRLNRSDLSEMVGGIQDLENKVLKNIVRRDQLRRLEVLDLASSPHPPSSSSTTTSGTHPTEPHREREEADGEVMDHHPSRDFGDEIQRLDREVNELRQEIGERMQDIYAEMTDL